MASANRDRLLVQPLGTSLRLSLHERQPSPGERVAEIDGAGHFRTDDRYGWLTLLPNGRYVIEQVAGSIQNVDQRKAKAAHKWAEEHDGEPSPAEAGEIAKIVRDWMDAIDMSASRAAELLGIPRRTLEGILQGRGFRYPRLLILAIQAFNLTADRT